MGSFPLRDVLRVVRPVFEDDIGWVYSAHDIPGFDVDKLEYFALSVFWRSAAHTWRDRDTIPQIDLGVHEDEIRRFLLGESGFPKEAYLLAGIWPAEPVPIATYFPVAEETQGYGLFRFYIPGFEFALCVGDKVPSEVRQLCCHNSALRLISVSRSPNYHAMSRLKRALDRARFSPGLNDFLRVSNPRG
jgi:hypothetical protein